MSTTIKDEVQRRYGQHAQAVTAGRAGGCCGASADQAAATCCDPVTSNLYGADDASAIPAEAVLASLGCGNPTALASLTPGEIVLDLGSGGGIDVLLSARRVGPAGKAYGLDMTDEMLALAEENKRKSGLTNVEFLRGEIEHIPLPDHSVDVIISNCVINLSADKDQVLREAFRVLKPGGRLAVSDIVTRGEIPADIRRSVELWVGCIAGALDEQDYLSKLRAAGFTDASIEPTRVYRVADAREFLQAKGIDADAVAASVDERFYSGFVRAAKPQRRAAMTSVEVFDPPMCCSTGVCGPAVDPLLAAFAADLQWLGEQGVQVTRHNLAQEPDAFVRHTTVHDLLQREGDACLPLVLVNDEVVWRGAYPRREALARAAGLAATASRTKPVIALEAAPCCTPDSGCR